MDFSLGSLRLVVFPRSMSDFEMAHFATRDVRARLDCVVEAAGRTAKRRLHLAFSSMSTSRVGQLNHISATTGVDSIEQWLTSLRQNASESIIFDLPSMDMTMKSEEVVREAHRVLEYDFFSKFVRRAENKLSHDQEDIFITLNVSLYSWLQLLRKNLTREMEQVQSASDLRVTTSPIANGGVTARRRRTLVDASPPVDLGAWRNASPPSTSHRTLPAQPTSSRSVSHSLSSTDLKEHRRTFSLASLSWTQDTQEKAGEKRNTQSRPPGLKVGTDGLGPPIDLASAPKSAAVLPSPITAASSMASSAPSPVIEPRETGALEYRHKERVIERLNMRQLGEATPDVMHPFFMKKAGFSLEDALPQYVHEYATIPVEQIMRALLKLYSKQLGDEVQDI